MYTVKCYNDDGTQFGEADDFEIFDDAVEYANEMAEIFLVDIVTPNGKTICVN